MDTIDFGPATRAVTAVLAGIRDDQLADPTPCPDFSVADLLDHLSGLSLAFTLAATQGAAPGRRPARRRRLPALAGLARPRSRPRSTGWPLPGPTPRRTTG